MGGAILSTGRKDYCTPPVLLEPIRDFFMALNGRDITLDPCSNPKSLVMATRNIMLESGLALDEARTHVAVELIKRALEKNLFRVQSAPGLTSVIGLEMYLESVKDGSVIPAMDFVPGPKLMDFITGDGLAMSWQGENTYFNPPFGYSKVTKIGIKNWIQKALYEAEMGKLRSQAEDRNVNTEIIACIPDTPETIPWKMGILLKADGRCQLGKRVPFIGMKQGIPKPISLVYFGSNPALFKEHFKHLGRVENPSVVYADQAEINPTF